jgi:hypothetical protein
MKANLKDILESIPDFDDFVNLANEIGELSFKKMQLENKIKAEEAVTFTKAINEFLIDGKRPSVSHIEKAYLHTGINGELLEERLKLADITAMLEKRKLLLSIYRDFLEVFRTVSANERSVSI